MPKYSPKAPRRSFERKAKPLLLEILVAEETMARLIQEAKSNPTETLENELGATIPCSLLVPHLKTIKAALKELLKVEIPIEIDLG